MKNTFQVLKKFPHLQNNHLRNSFEGNNWIFFLKYLSSCGLLRRKRNWVTFSVFQRQQHSLKKMETKFHLHAYK
jgi:hypothetical protein